ncbi:MAG: pyridoxal phosphate-dependent aminotransferase [Deltaproteobacteria bacterium]|nr:pyridoxal phosphate-dependent aminotransferase [Deltaproteobacteria bacterium]
MEFDENEYLSWYLPLARGGQGINLHSSGMPAIEPSEFLPATGRPWSLTPRLEQAFASWLGLSPEQVMFTPGATGGNLFALLGLAPAGSEVIVESPIYEPMVRQAYRVNRVKRLFRSFEKGWTVGPDDLKPLVGNDTSLAIITEPHNPSGVVTERSQIFAIADYLESFGAYILVNEVYRGFGEWRTLAGERENLLVVGSFSKLCGTYWARLGYLAGHEKVLDKMRRVRMNLGPASEAAAGVGLKVMDSIGELQQRARETAAKGIPLADEWVKRTRSVSWVRPEASGFGCIKLPAGVNDIELVKRLYEEDHVAAIPGSLFGASGTLRISWLQAGEQLEKGLAVLGKRME